MHRRRSPRRGAVPDNNRGVSRRRIRSRVDAALERFVTGDVLALPAEEPTGLPASRALRPRLTGGPDGERDVTISLTNPYARPLRNVRPSLLIGEQRVNLPVVGFIA